MNLLRNAADAMKGVEERQLLLRTEPEKDNAVRVSVRDSGIGVSADNLERIFDAFYTTKIDGMGIGLSVSRTIVESHGGRLWAEPNNGPGATVSFVVPALFGGHGRAQQQRRGKPPRQQIGANHTGQVAAKIGRAEIYGGIGREPVAGDDCGQKRRIGETG